MNPLPPAARWPLRLYRTFFPIVFGALLPGFLLRMVRRGNYRRQFGQRLGFYSPEAKAVLGKGSWLWIHAVSVGEMMMGLRLARELQAGGAGRILLSTTTSTGLALARGELEALRRNGEVELIYYPLDVAGIVHRALNLIRPSQLVLIDKDFWPNMITECYRRGIPVSIVNARLSARSEERFRRFRRWVAPFFGMLRQVCIQEPEDAERWVAIGVRPEAVHYTGSLKFDYSATDSLSQAEQFRALLRQGGWSDSPILLGGSTFPGEERALGEVLRQLRPRFPNLRLILVPRHVERTPEVEATLRELNLSYTLRTRLAECREIGDVLLVNTTGELRHWYAVADVCFVGKSLTAKLGQNPAEPILAGKPVVFGPHMGNFEALVTKLRSVNSVNQVPDQSALCRTVEELLLSPEKGAAQVARAREVLSRHEGACRRTAALLLSSPQEVPKKI